MKNDPCSFERNLCNCVRSLKKKNQDFNGIWTHDLAIPVWCSNQLSYEATDNVLIVPLFPNPENNGLHSVCSLHFLLSTNLYIKDQQDMSILIFLFKKYN